MYCGWFLGRVVLYSPFHSAMVLFMLKHVLKCLDMRVCSCFGSVLIVALYAVKTWLEKLQSKLCILVFSSSQQLTFSLSYLFCSSHWSRISSPFASAICNYSFSLIFSAKSVCMAFVSLMRSWYLSSSSLYSSPSVESAIF